MNFLRKVSVLAQVLGCNLLGLRQPIACHYSITNRCPWHCVYCGFKNKEKKECNTEEAKEVIRLLAKNGNARLHLVGGEPALREDLGQLVDEAKKNKLFVTMATTGFGFPAIWERVKDIDIFFLSFDGPKEIHDRQRGRGAFDTLFTAIDLLKSKSKKFWTTTVLTKDNISQIDYILEMAKKIGFKTNFHLLYFTPTQTYLDKAFHLSQAETQFAVSDDYRKALKYLLLRKKTDAKNLIAHSESHLRCLSEWSDYNTIYSEKRNSKYRCWAGRMYCYIDANADLYPCGDAMGRVQPKNILRLGFKEAFDSLPPIPCQSCLVACYGELNMMFSLNPEAILNWSGII